MFSRTIFNIIRKNKSLHCFKHQSASSLDKSSVFNKTISSLQFVANGPASQLRSSRFFSTAASRLGTVDEIKQLEEWKKNFTFKSMPVSRWQTAHTRSGGNGGQNVNCVATKIEFRFKVSDQEFWMPPLMIRVLRENQANRINKKDEFYITSQRHRTQGENYQDCLEKIYQILCGCTKTDPPPDQEKLQKQAQQKKVANERRLVSKAHQKRKNQRPNFN